MRPVAHPSATTALVLGVLSFCFGPFTGIPALLLAMRVHRDVREAPQRFSGGTGSATAGAVVGALGSALWMSAIMSKVLVRSNGTAIGAIVVGVFFTAAGIASVVVPQLRARMKWPATAALGFCAFVPFVSAGVFYSDRGQAMGRCSELVAKIEADTDTRKSATLEAANQWFDAKAKELDGAERVCQQAEAASHLEGIAAGREALSKMRSKAADDFTTAITTAMEQRAVALLQEARTEVDKAEQAAAKKDYNATVGLLAVALGAVEGSERIRRACSGPDASKCSDAAGLTTQNRLTQAALEMEDRLRQDRLDVPAAKDAAEIIEAVRAVREKHRARLDPVLNARAKEREALAAKAAKEREAAIAEATVRGDWTEAELLVDQYIRDRIPAPDSYETVSRGEREARGRYWVIPRTWKFTNAFGAKIQRSETFCVSAGTIRSVKPCS